MEDRREELMLRAIRNLIIQNKLLELQIINDRDPYIEEEENERVKNLEKLKGRDDFVSAVQIIEHSLVDNDLIVRVDPMQIANMFGFDFISFQKEVSEFIFDRDGINDQEDEAPRVGTYHKMYSLIKNEKLSGSVPDFLIKDTIKYFSSEEVEDFRKCNEIKEYFQKNPDRIYRTPSRK